MRRSGSGRKSSAGLRSESGTRLLEFPQLSGAAEPERFEKLTIDMNQQRQQGRGEEDPPRVTGAPNPPGVVNERPLSRAGHQGLGGGGAAAGGAAGALTPGTVILKFVGSEPGAP